MKRIELAEALGRVHESAPLVQCITNFVTVNDCANILLAVGGSPVMSMDIREAAEMVGRVRALVCNMGAIESVDAMVSAGKRANELGVPVVLDPVAVGGTALRREAGRCLLEEVRFTAIRGNASEIRSLAGQTATGSGVDAAAPDAVTEDRLDEAAQFVEALARRIGGVVAVSGALDLISDGTRTAVVRNGCATMARITGSGCMLTSLIGAFCGAMPADPFTATAAAVIAMGVCGQRAERARLEKGTGNATFRTDMIDAVFNLTEEELVEEADYEILR